MDLRVVGCHGGETPRHRTSAFVLDDRLAIDAGSLTSGLDLPAQCALEAVLVSHAHLDHIRDLATIADNRFQRGCEPLIVAGTKPTLAVLRKHFFNGLLWPDFSKLPTAKRPAIKYLELRPEVPMKVAGYTVRAVLVSHTIETAAFVVEAPKGHGGRGGGAIAYSGDTGPTERLWKVLNGTPNLRAMLMEVSFPNDQQRLATVSGHHTPATLRAELKKLEIHKDFPFLLYHIKPAFQAKVERELARIRGLSLTVLNLGDQFIL
ncbi:MAG TPA: 3',5'-cyclic-nucleotide phosphodiesterase [Polyangiaceae bacterium]|jgi:3',5'-cyclic-nucleotide phosphodiesterase